MDVRAGFESSILGPTDITNTFSVSLVEPVVSLGVSRSPASGDSYDLITYTLTSTAGSASNDNAGYNLEFVDSGLTAAVSAEEYRVRSVVTTVDGVPTTQYQIGDTGSFATALESRGLVGTVSVLEEGIVTSVAVELELLPGVEIDGDVRPSFEVNWQSHPAIEGPVFAFGALPRNYTEVDGVRPVVSIDRSTVS